MRRPMLWVFSCLILGILFYQSLFLPYVGDGQEPALEREDPMEAVVTGYVERWEEKENSLAVPLSQVTIHTDDEAASGEKVKKILLYASKDLSLRIGNRVEAAGSLSRFERPTNPGQFNELEYYQSMGYAYKMFAERVTVTDESYSVMRQALSSLKNRLKGVYQAILEEKEAGVVSAMVLGDKAELDGELRELYKRNGIAHVLAISGLHVTLVGAFFFRTLLSARAKLEVASGASIVFLVAYAEMTGFSLSTSRAVLMLVLSMLANVLARSYDAQTALSIGGCLMLAGKPKLLFQSGFLLSYGAVAGILFVLPVLESIAPSRKDLKWTVRMTAARLRTPLKKEGALERASVNLIHTLIEGTLLSLAVLIATFPVLAYFFYEIPVYAIWLNLIVIPCMALVVGLSLLGGVAGLASLYLGRFLIGGVPLLLGLYEQLCLVAMKLPLHSLVVGKPQAYQIAAYYPLLAGSCFVWKMTEDETKWKPKLKQSKPIRARRLGCLFLCLLLPLLFLVPSNDKGVLEVTMLDVGQGDGIYVKMPEGTTVLIDGGSSDEKNLGRYRLEPFLKSKGVGRLDYAFLTHADEDHISGMRELMQGLGQNGLEIGTLVMANTNFVDEAYREMEDLAKEKGVGFAKMEAGMTLKAGEAYLKCLHPAADFPAQSRNEYSLVCRLTYREFDLLLTGDVEDNGESVFIREDGHPANGYDALKVAHHGSKNSTSEEFLRIAKPTVALISCGWKNRYGHPNPELVKRLEDGGSKWVGTVEQGAVSLFTDGAKIRMESYVNGTMGEWECK